MAAVAGQASQLPGAPGGIVFPDYNQVYDHSTMAGVPKYEAMLNQNSGGYNKFRDFALAKGPSSYANAQNRALRLNNISGKDSLARATQGQNALAMGNLAAQGGLSSGARERTVQAGQKSYVDGAQDLSRSNALAMLNVGAQDQGQKLNALGALPGMEQSRVSGWNDARSKDVANQMAETGRVNEYNLARSQEINRAIAAQREAEALAAEKKKKGEEISFTNGPFNGSWSPTASLFGRQNQNNWAVDPGSNLLRSFGL